MKTNCYHNNYQIYSKNIINLCLIKKKYKFKKINIVNKII